MEIFHPAGAGTPGKTMRQEVWRAGEIFWGMSLDAAGNLPMFNVQLSFVI
jgi:hypothetical protein